MLYDLRAEKKKILDDVMEKETYKVAKEILEKFAPDQLKKDVVGLLNICIMLCVLCDVYA